MTTETGAETPIQTFYDGPLFDPLAMRDGLSPVAGIPAHGLAPAESDISCLDLAGRTLQLRVEPSGSFFGDCIRVVDAPDEAPLAPGFPAFGWSGLELLGGAAMTAARLRGDLSLRFDEPLGDGRLPLVVECPQPLVGCDGVLAAPDGYELPARDNEVALIGPPSRGLLDRASGRVYDFHLNCEFRNTAITALLAENPGLEPPPLLFPGSPHAGHALAWFAISERRELCFHVAAEMFLPLGVGSQSAPLRLPPSPRLAHGSSFPARNSALHPFIYLSCASRLADVPASLKSGSVRTVGSAACPEGALRARENTHVKFFCWPEKTCFGDDFDLVTDELGGQCLAQSPLFGELEVQFGKITDGFAPFSLNFAPPAQTFEPKFARLLQMLPPGTRPGLVGMRGEMSFPNYSYDQRNLSLNSDPYKPSVGVVDVATGRFRIVLRKYLFQDLMLQLLTTEPRTPSDSFAYLATGEFGAAGGVLTLELDGALFIPYPKGYLFPLPDGRATTAKDGSRLVPFLHLDATESSSLRALPPDQSLNFAGAEHVRGRPVAALSLALEPLEPGLQTRRFALRADDKLVEGRGNASLHAQHRECSLIAGELFLDGGESVCNYYLTVAPGGAQLQMISPDEQWDLWFRGRSG
jgi:hypothetical protein